MAKVLSTQLCVPKWVFILLLSYKSGSQLSGLLIFHHLNSVLLTPAFGTVLHSQHSFCAQLQNPSSLRTHLGTPAPLAKTNCIPIPGFLIATFITLPWIMLLSLLQHPCPHAIWASRGVRAWSKPAGRALSQISGHVIGHIYGLSHSWTHKAEVGEPHTSSSKQLYLPHCFLYSPMFTLYIRALLPSYDSCPMPHPSHIPTQHC